MEQQKLSPNLDDLPDDLLLHILSFLPMTEVGRTSILSKWWKNLWKSVPKIDFSETNIAETPELIAAVDIALSNREALKIREFWVHANCDLCPMDKVESWIDCVVKHKVEVLYLDLTPHSTDHEDCPLIPERLFQNKSLTALTLKFCMIDLPPKFCLISLKTLHFRSVEFDNEELTILLSNCPVLKDLTLDKCNFLTDLKIIAMDSHLKNLNIHEEDSCDSDGQNVFEISAPNLVTLNFFGTPRRSKYIGKNLDSLVSVNFNFIYPRRYNTVFMIPPLWRSQEQLVYGKFIEDFFHAEVIKLSSWCTMNLLLREIRSIGNSGSDTVTDLAFTTPCWPINLKGLVDILKYFVNLKVLTINIMDVCASQFSGFFYGECFANTYWRPDDPSVFGLQKHLRIVKIHGFLDSYRLLYLPEFYRPPEDIIKKRNREFEFVRFLLKNVTELETMIITLSGDLNIFPATERFDILFRLSSRLLAFPRSSPNAQVLIHHDHLTGIRENGR